MYSTFCWSSIPFPSFPLTLHNVLSEIENNRRLMLVAKFIRDELAVLSRMTSSILKCSTEAAVGVTAAGGGRGCPTEAAVAGWCVGVTAAGGGRGCPTEAAVAGWCVGVTAAGGGRGCSTEAAVAGWCVGVTAAGEGRGCSTEAAVAGWCVGVTAAGEGRGCPTEVIAGMVGGGIWRASGPCSQ